eukprot:CAMPEP_0202857128 /NCGR_PEP_ID=MMETSP1391-20130828/178_1 /ASSEMBLY_ACC=CAM_ASM_000867 /TAXON_ID=1034604 /ORGANISM="Chlamydomonas leiostraca, Strain SAG 11-49" /LENGTH=229 /DNA_ID=CAMNT_0049535887 /DNA_START=873 /DNA_END=1564 /DNA_ORIENTATION=+
MGGGSPLPATNDSARTKNPPSTHGTPAPAPMQCSANKTASSAKKGGEKKRGALLAVSATKPHASSLPYNLLMHKAVHGTFAKDVRMQDASLACSALPCQAREAAMEITRVQPGPARKHCTTATRAHKPQQFQWHMAPGERKNIKEHAGACTQRWCARHKPRTATNHTAQTTHTGGAAHIPQKAPTSPSKKGQKGLEGAVVVAEKLAQLHGARARDLVQAAPALVQPECW